MIPALESSAGVAYPQPQTIRVPEPAGGRTVEYAAWGEGPPLLFVHGAMGGFDQGVLLARAAVGEAGYRCVAISRPGYLGTPLASGKLPEEQADLCAGLLDALGIARAGVIAISGGGQTALQFALRHSSRCSALVAISACSAPITVRLPLQFHIMKLVAHVPALVRAMARKAAREPERGASRSIPDPVLRARTLAHPEAGPLMAALQRSTLHRMAERMPGTLNDIDHSRRPFAYPLERIAVPTLVVHGTDDEAAPFAAGQAMAARVPGAELFIVEGGRHVSLFTHLDAIRARVGDFLRRYAA